MTAEAAVVLSVLVAFTMALVWGLLVVAARIQCVDAARTGARAAARQDPPDAVVQVTRDAAPRGARVTVGREGDQVRVTVVARAPVLTGLPFEIREEAVAAAEEAVGSGSGTAAEGTAGSGLGTAGDPARGSGSGTAGAARPGSGAAHGTGEMGP
ncbi:TadE family type IV pilus minor pilin [Streptomyces cellostaticus]|uniref:TadE family type IV pilus minor pilin n=1 Tax=Streptomyces cellostaticus TaxID=67285 RepID=UPI000B308614